MVYNVKARQIVERMASNHGIKSDHSIVKFSIKIENTQQKGKGFFKFNSQLLRDEEYVNQIKSLITTFESNDFKVLFWNNMR